GHVQVQLQDPPLAQPLQPPGEEHLPQLAPESPLFTEPEVLRQLLGDRRSAAPEMAVLQRGGERDPGLLLVDPVVLEESRVLAVHHRADQPGGDAVERHPMLVAPAGAAPLACLVHAGLDQRGGGRIPLPQRLRRRQRQPEQSAQETQADGGKGRPVGDLAWAYVGGHRIEYKRDPLAASFSIRHLLGVLRDNRDFRTLYAANAVSQLGDWFNVVALFSLLLELTGKGQAVAFALLTRFVPMFLAGPAAGVVADRLSRRAIMIVSDVARAALVLCLLFVRRPAGDGDRGGSQHPRLADREPPRRSRPARRGRVRQLAPPRARPARGEGQLRAHARRRPRAPRLVRGEGVRAGQRRGDRGPLD